MVQLADRVGREQQKVGNRRHPEASRQAGEQVCHRLFIDCLDTVKALDAQALPQRSSNKASSRSSTPFRRLNHRSNREPLRHVGSGPPKGSMMVQSRCYAA